MRDIAVKFALTLTVAILVAGCQGLYVAGDAGPHSTRSSTEPMRSAAPPGR